VTPAGLPARLDAQVAAWAAAGRVTFDLNDLEAALPGQQPGSLRAAARECPRARMVSPAPSTLWKIVTPEPGPDREDPGCLPGEPVARGSMPGPRLDPHDVIDFLDQLSADIEPDAGGDDPRLSPAALADLEAIGRVTAIIRGER
jgi:hypothetical protein